MTGGPRATKHPAEMTRDERITAAAIILRDAVEELAVAEQLAAVHEGSGGDVDPAG